MIQVTWELLVQDIQPTLAALHVKLVRIDPNDKCAVAACQAAIRTYEDVLGLPARLTRKVAEANAQTPS